MHSSGSALPTTEPFAVLYTVNRRNLHIPHNFFSLCFVLALRNRPMTRAAKLSGRSLTGSAGTALAWMQFWACGKSILHQWCEPVCSAVGVAKPPECFSAVMASRSRTITVVFVSLILDLLGFTVILPLLPSLLEYYSKSEVWCYRDVLL